LKLADNVEALDRVALYLRTTKVPTLAGLLESGLNERVARRAMVFSGLSDERPNDPALVRVASRVFGCKHENEAGHIESQIATTMLVGEDSGAIAYSAAIEVGEKICTYSSPAD
jgi:hypothetical protein